LIPDCGPFSGDEINPVSADLPPANDYQGNGGP